MFHIVAPYISEKFFIQELLMIIFFRVFLLAVSAVLAFIFFYERSLTAGIIAAGTGIALALLFLILVEYVSHAVSKRIIIASMLGLVAGLVIAHLVNLAFLSISIEYIAEYKSLISPALYLFAGFAVMMFFAINHEEFVFIDKIVPRVITETGGSATYKILDTSVIIDGRISDICDTGFLEGILVIPNFVLNELQMIADSADSIKRNRGRRGLDILNKMQKDQSIMVKISDVDFSDTNEVDAKLVKLAKVMKAKVITNDFNLNKVAEFHGVKVLNINQLSNALKPVVLPGEEMTVTLIKEGKDPSQAIGYLDDGTMVVVENGRSRLHEEVKVTVTSVLQTTAGRMIFTRI